MALTTQEQSSDVEVREALMSVIEQAARRILTEYSDDRLLGQRQASMITAVERAVRGELPRMVPTLVGQVSRWRLDQLLREHVGSEVRKHQGRALVRQHDAAKEASPGGEFALIETINGVEHYTFVSYMSSSDRHST